MRFIHFIPGAQVLQTPRSTIESQPMQLLSNSLFDEGHKAFSEGCPMDGFILDLSEAGTARPPSSLLGELSQTTPVPTYTFNLVTSRF